MVFITQAFFIILLVCGMPCAWWVGNMPSNSNLQSLTKLSSTGAYLFLTKAYLCEIQDPLQYLMYRYICICKLCHGFHLQCASSFSRPNLLTFQFLKKILEWSICNRKWDTVAWQCYPNIYLYSENDRLACPLCNANFVCYWGRWIEKRLLLMLT